MKCKFCSREIANPGALKAHENSCKNNPDRIIRVRSPLAGAKKGGVGYPAWNKGKTKATDVRLRNQKFSTLGHPHSEETKAKLSEVAKSQKRGGYIPGSGRGKSGWYRGIYCSSSWELAVVIYCLDHDVSISRCSEIRTYKIDGKSFKYYPDFVIRSRIVEVKGYHSPISIAKQSFNRDILFVFEKDLKDVFSYVKRIYGKDYIKLYG